VLHHGKQVDLAAVASGASERPAVHRQGTSTPVGVVTVGEPGADGGGQGVRVEAGEGPADGGLGRDGPMVGGVAVGAERGTDWLRDIGGPFGDRGHRPGARQDRGGGHSQDGKKRVAAATAGSRVVDRGEVGEQVGRFGGL
jgi:hypothetical protein